MNRREALAALFGAIAAPKIFLPPAGGWPTNLSRYTNRTYSLGFFTTAKEPGINGWVSREQLSAWGGQYGEALARSINETKEQTLQRVMQDVFNSAYDPGPPSKYRFGRSLLPR